MAGLANTLGNGTMTNDLVEFATYTDVFLLIGTNTSECHPIIAMQIQRGLERGAKMIVIDPKRTDMAKKADIYLQIPIGSNIKTLNTMMNVILSENLQDDEFIANYTHGFEYLKEAVKDFTPEKFEQETGIKASLIIEAARMYAKAGTAAICYTMGITQFTDGTSNVFSLSNLALMTGNLGKKGAGVNPLRGQNNVQGACDMGALPNVIPAGAVNSPYAQEQARKVWHFELNPTPGVKLTQAPDKMDSGEIKLLYVFGENPVMSDPWTQHFIRSIHHLDCFIVQDLFLTETAQKADIVLPAACWGEKDGTFLNTSRRVQRTRKASEPVGGVEPDWKVVCNIANRMGLEGFNFGNAEQVWNELRELMPKFFGGISYYRLEKLGGISWPCPDEDHPGTPVLYTDKKSMLPDGKFRFVPVIYLDDKTQRADAEAKFRDRLNIPNEYPVGSGVLSEVPTEIYPCLFTTGRKVYHYHTGSMTRECPALEYGAGVEGALIEVSPDIANERDLQEGCYALVENKRGKIAAKLHVNSDLKESTIFTTFHYSEADGNELTNAGDPDPLSGITPLKMTIANIKKLSEDEFIKFREQNEMDMHSETPYLSARH
ncbi:molybdopterin-dependent oxidoreductase [Campylobacter sp. RM12920]|uniref:Molybdopterin-dependent oxidoreductase n=1 Tax=Campylobacter californiensis TaxID=1032243 RepID=A0ABD4JHN8_9BACT|nr:molybdopterin-dependent oxidoreductase [Campylobacter sp. RM12919]MBE2987921.1 molybdopterin-dependent oxidoreductase [Campylobacter sp. RM12920]